MLSLLYTLVIYPLYIIIECIFTVSRKITSDNGLSVISVSIGITLMCLPLYAVAEKWQETQRNIEKKLSSGIERIKKAFKGDEQYMIMSTFYKENHYHPLMALRSSFGLLIQIPFFMAAYGFLSKLELLNGSRFLFIRDMGQPDAMFSIGKFSINILPIAMTLINIIAGAIYTKGFKFKDKLQIYAMALVFLVILYNSPSGLVLYWTMNNIFSLIKNIFYKFKKPLKSFYILCCIVTLIVFIYILFFYHTKTANRLIASIFCIAVFFIPIVVNIMNRALDSTLKLGIQNKKLRHSIYLLSCIVLFILSGITIPSALISSSPIEFSNIGSNSSPLILIINCAVQSLGFFIFWPICIYLLFGRKTQTFLSALMTFIAIGSILNTFIFMLSYGDISQTLAFLNPASFKTMSFISFLNIAALIILASIITLFLFTLKGKFFSSLLSIILLAIISISIVNIFLISREYKRFTTTTSASDITEVKPLFHLSKNSKNVVLFMLDKAQTQYINEILKEDPNLYNTLEGFKCYPNVISFNGHTLMGSPGLYGGYEYTPEQMNIRSDEKLVDKHNQALLLLPRVFTEQADFTAVSADPSWSNYNVFTDLSIFNDYDKIQGYQTIGCYNEVWFRKHPESRQYDTTETILNRNLLFFSIFRESPILLRELLYNHSSYWSSDEVGKNFRTMMDNYAVLDLLPELTSVDGEKSSYTVIANELTHEKYLFQAPDYTPEEQVTDRGTSKFKDDPSYHTQMAAMKMLGNWINYLKEKGIYDNTRIVFVSDHGGANREDCFDSNEELDKAVSGNQYEGRAHYHCLLMVKDFNSLGKLEFDNTFMTNADVPSILLKGVIEHPVNPFTNKEIPLDTSVIKKDGVYITTCDVHQAGWNGSNTFSIKENEWWHVKDNIFDSKNWTQKSPFNQDN
ncbi:MAG: YidC/Oxa1 family membrane protein insertase [Treponema sp.]|nr:YidC/Oxa1 family membrane protein insertase [Treponema sp.]